MPGKTLRLNDDGTAPTDNPFYGRKDANPEVFTMGHRDQPRPDDEPVHE